MNKKITISELSQLLSTNVSLINKKGWEDFLRLFFAQISEGLQAEGNVKIKGLGTFKVVTVDARKSKDVNTGANTVIPAHNKISFTPDSSLAEILNKPYAHFESTYVLAPEGEVDAPESEDEEETVVEEVKADTAATPVVETIVEQATAAAAMAEPTIEPETVAEPETKVASETVAEQETAAEATSEANVETEQVAEVESATATVAIEQEAAAQTVSESSTEAENQDSNTTVAESQTGEDNTEVSHIETTPAAEIESESSSTSTVEENDGEETEGKEDEDPNADDDENVDTTPEEVAAYASTFKRHDLPADEEDDDNDKNGHGKKLGIAIILFLLILAVVGLVAWMSDPNIIGRLREKLTGNEPAKTEIKVDPVDVQETKEIEDQVIAEIKENNPEAANMQNDSTGDFSSEAIENAATEAAGKPAAQQSSNKNVQKSTNFKDDFVAYMKTKHPEMDITDQGDPVEEKLNNNSRLTLVSLHHYGAKDFWVYIYLYNKDVIKNPNNIKAGTNIKIPMLDNKKFVNPDSEHSILTAKEVQHKFVK